MVKKTALGKGLGALIPNIKDEIVVDKEEEKNVSFIPVNLITADKEQPRKNFDEEKILELSESIKQHGMIQPVILRKKGDIYIIVAGERRWRASKLIGLKEIPAIVKDLSEKEVVEISLIENIVREDLNPIEEALAFKKLLNEFNLTQEEISKRICKSRSAIANCMRLLNLDKAVQEYLIDGVISEGHGRALLSLEDKELQYNTAQKIIDEQLNVRQTERLIKEIINKKSNKKVKKETKKDPYYKDLENKLENYFNTKVSLNCKKDNKGKIEIEYYSEEELQRIIELLHVKI